MKKLRIVSAILAAIVLTMYLSIPVMAFDAEKHDEYLEKVLFGDEYNKDSKTQKIKDKIKMLEYASYLCVDQDRGDGAEELSFLKKQKVRGLPKLADFDLTGIFYGNHRNYTHRGWNYSYVIPKGKKHDKANWPVRKALLCATVNKVFDFGWKNELFGNVCRQCDSFSAIIYYVHILGDHIEKEDYQVSDLTIPLAREHADENNLDVFYEIKLHSEVLFEAQKETFTYTSFMQDLEELADTARSISGSKGGVSADNYADYHQCAIELMETMIRYVPLLLEDVEYFKSEFYS